MFGSCSVVSMLMQHYATKIQSYVKMKTYGMKDMFKI